MPFFFKGPVGGGSFWGLAINVYLYVSLSIVKFLLPRTHRNRKIVNGSGLQTLSAIGLVV